jgi:uncharacterized protein YbjT (DUF2867 family)
VRISKRAYVLTPAGRSSVRARAARRANLEKARAAAKEIIYRPTPRRQAASRANLEKALAARLTPEETERRAYALGEVFTDFQPFFTAVPRLEAQIERCLRRLLRRRSGGAIKFKVFAPRRESLFDDLDEWPVEEVIKRMRKL